MKEFKSCSFCKEEKSTALFSKDASRKDGFYIYCKLCNNKKLLDKYYKNREATLEKRKAAYKANPAKFLAGQKKYYADNREEILARQRTRVTFEMRKAWNLRKFWPGKTTEEALESYNILLEAQKNLCAICNRLETAPDPVTGKIKALSVDHCHLTGKVRGLLCSKCNFGIGYFDDNPEILNKAVKYLCA